MKDCLGFDRNERNRFLKIGVWKGGNNSTLLISFGTPFINCGNRLFKRKLSYGKKRK
jgi:hypothetical protein